MSLECEGHGGVCEACGQFDFLPTTCPQCHRVLCQQHVRRHHPTPTAASWCDCGITGHNPHDALASHDASGASTSAGQHLTTQSSTASRCYVCGSEWCVLCPCPICRQCFCAAHRFHGHEEAVDEARRRKPRRAAQKTNSAFKDVCASPDGDDEETSANARIVEGSVGAWLAQRCEPFTPDASLTLAPPQYRSRMMPVTALVVYLPSPSAQMNSVKDEGDARVDALSTTAAPFTGVCSLTVATESTVGQLVERLVHALELWHVTAPQDATTDVSAAVRQMQTVQDAHPFKIAVDHTADPPLSLSALPLSAVTRHVLTPQDVLCVHIGASPHATTACLTDAVRAVVLAPTKGTGGKRDVRLHALATRLRLRATATSTQDVATHASSPSQSPQPPPVPLDTRPGTAEDPATATHQGGHPAAIHAGTEAVDETDQGQPVSIVTASPQTGPADEAQQWPFRTPQPLTSFVFANRKGDPFGREAITDKSTTVIIALFVEDADLPRPVPPFCCAVSTAWSLGRLMDQFGRGVEHFASSACASRMATYGLWLMNETGTAPDAPLRCVTSDIACTEAKQVRALKNGDVLLCGRLARSASSMLDEKQYVANREVLAEVQRLRQLKGKDQAALRLNMMKQCVLM